MMKIRFDRDLFERDVRRSRDGELMEQAVGLDVRLLCGAVALMLFGMTLWTGLRATLIFSPIPLALGALAVFGWRVAVVDPEASRRFHELADPVRELPADMLSKAPGRERPRP
jgi:hypothetical protein